MLKLICAIGSLTPAILCVMLSGCEVGSPDTVSPITGNNYSGYYVNPSGGTMVAGNSGGSVTSITLNQSGDRLQAVDNNGILFKGTVSDGSSNQPASFILNGSTTTGVKVIINGTLQGGNSSTLMTGLWIEPAVILAISGKSS